MDKCLFIFIGEEELVDGGYLSPEPPKKTAPVPGKISKEKLDKNVFESTFISERNGPTYEVFDKAVLILKGDTLYRYSFGGEYAEKFIRQTMP